MPRTAVLVDAGYVFAQGSILLTGTKQSREYLSLDIPGVTKALKQTVADCSALSLLRIYWYDAMRIGRPTHEQMELADSLDIKIRLGQVNAAGEQKGVDALIITDLADLARNHAMSDAVLVSGDEDVRVGVILAQQFGVRVHLIGIHPAKGNQSRSLRQEADTIIEWDRPVVQSFLRYTPPITAAATATTATASELEGLVEKLIETINLEDLIALKSQFEGANPQVPNQYDRTLLKIGRDHYTQTALSTSEKTIIRNIFIRLVLAKQI